MFGETASVSKIITLSRPPHRQAFILVSLIPRLHPQTRKELACLGAEPGSEATFTVNGYIMSKVIIITRMGKSACHVSTV